jgi:DNA-binding GntR family transcriptional regulator
MNARPDLPPPAAGKAQTQVQQAHARIEELIITLTLPPGEIVTEAGIAALLGIGRTPVREALQQLAREGLVVILPKRGILISSIDIRQQLRMLEFRRAIESFIARAAAERATATERELFAAYAAQFEAIAETGDGAGFLDLDNAFTRSLAECARNEFASGALRLVRGLSRRFAHAFDRERASLRQSARHHANLAAAIASGDADAAERELGRLIDAVEHFTRGALDRP